MGKRRATKQLNQDNFDKESDDSQQDEPQGFASNEVLATRKIIKVKRHVAKDGSILEDTQ